MTVLGSRTSTGMTLPSRSTNTPKNHALVVSSLIAVVMFVSGMRPVQAYTPEDPVVQGIVDRGIDYLENAGASTNLSKPGERILVAYAHLKCRHNPENPIVRRGIDDSLKIYEEIVRGEKRDHESNYINAVAVLLLAEADPDRYKEQLEMLGRQIVDSQLNNGGFTYPGEKLGDTSQAQYAMLAIWTLDRNGIPLDYAKIAAGLRWLLRVQDPSGSWPYHGVDPGPNQPLQSQKRVDASMGLAGGSALLIGGDVIRLWGDTGDNSKLGIPGLPKAIRLYKEDKNKGSRKLGGLKREMITRSLGGLERWRKQNPYQKKLGNLSFHYYIIYTLERYESFQEIAKSLPKDKSPGWYNVIVDELKESQDDKGGWSGRTFTNAPVNTAFALLFLIRSTQKAIITSSSGTLEGGQGFPADTTKIRLEGTQIKGEAIATQVSDLLSVLEEDGADNLGGKSIPDNLQLANDPVARKAQIDRLERLVRGSNSYQARRVAAKLLGRSDELRVVPSLIFALSDPDVSVHSYARDGLRFISRKFDGFDFPRRPADPKDEKAMARWRGAVKDVQDKWREWYRRIDPTHVFLDYDL